MFTKYDLQFDDSINPCIKRDPTFSKFLKGSTGLSLHPLAIALMFEFLWFKKILTQEECRLHDKPKEMYFCTLRNARLFLSACTDVSVLQYELFLVAYVTMMQVISQFARSLDGISRCVFCKLWVKRAVIFRQQSLLILVYLRFFVRFYLRFFAFPAKKL